MRFVVVNFTRLPFELGCRPSPASMTPAFTSCSLKLPISVKSFLFGICPASDSSLAFTSTITRMAASVYVSVTCSLQAPYTNIRGSRSALREGRVQFPLKWRQRRAIQRELHGFLTHGGSRCVYA